jgi:hypothetical protein
MLPESEIKKQLSEVYVNAVCSIAGFSMSKPNFDCGIDYHINEVITEPDGTFHETGISLDIQLKSTIDFQIKDNKIIYGLKNKNYNDLSTETVGTKRILVLLTLPNKKIEWLKQNIDQLILKKCAHWICLEGNSSKENIDSSTTIYLPIDNIFSEENLKLIFKNIKEGKKL